MKYIITILLFFFLVACEGRTQVQCDSGGAIGSVIMDKRCLAISQEAYKKGTETGVCYRGPLQKGRDKGAIDPDPEACDAIYEEANKKCDALPPPGPGDMGQLSGGGIYKNGKLIMKDGEPVCD